MKKRIIMTAIAVMMVLCYCTTIHAQIMGFNASAIQKTDNYDDNQAINRVFYVSTGSSKASRTLSFTQKAGTVEYYMYKNSTKEVYQSYRIFAYNKKTKKGKSYYWNWSKSKTITLDKKADYTIIVYPSNFDKVCSKYLTTSILKLRPIIYGYKTSPHFTIETSATIKYSDKDSIKIAKNVI